MEHDVSDVRNELEQVADLLTRCRQGLLNAMSDAEVALSRLQRIRDSQKGADTDALKALACWMGGNDTGLSSMAIAVATLTGSPGKGMPPSDTSDFGRCYRLLRAHPMCAEGLAVLGKQGSPVWRAMVASWGELTTLYEAIGFEAAGMEAPRRARYGQPESPERIAYEAACEAMYLRMKQIIREAQHPVRRVDPPSDDGAQDERVYVIRDVARGQHTTRIIWLGGRSNPRKRWVVTSEAEALRFSKEEAQAELAKLADEGRSYASGWAIALVEEGVEAKPLSPDAMMQDALSQLAWRTGANEDQSKQGDAA